MRKALVLAVALWVELVAGLVVMPDDFPHFAPYLTFLKETKNQIKIELYSYVNNILHIKKYYKKN